MLHVLHIFSTTPGDLSLFVPLIVEKTQIMDNTEQNTQNNGFSDQLQMILPLAGGILLALLIVMTVLRDLLPNIL